MENDSKSIINFFIGVLCLVVTIVIIVLIVSAAKGDSNKNNSSSDSGQDGGQSGQPGTDQITEFPVDMDDVAFSIQYKNSTNKDIKVWLDDQPFCKQPSDNTDAPCRQGAPVLPSTNWNSNLGTFYVLKKENNAWTSQKMTGQRSQTLKPGEIWRIVPPVGTDGKPYWCFDQGCPICFDANNNPSWCADPDYKSRRVCAGVGAWVTPADKTMNAIQSVTKFEYNINGGQLWFDVSAVDGINCNSIVQYTKCKDKQQSCMIDLSKCPRTATVNGVVTCPSPKTWEDIEQCGRSGIGSEENVVAQLAECPYGAEPGKADCHKWWSNNQCAQDWINWLQNNPSGKKCNQYAWAYDEMKYMNGDGFTDTYDPCILDASGKCTTARTNTIQPLITCAIDKGALNIDIQHVRI